ncbi:uncharacterized protein LOC121419597 [Lytechinus variegatus]|uniref:uncharacterized protein LOC121419597 n=1 Tax=Lytechinus variegatus TaxID=7654 RepID=UPI001BB27CFB|nr:uncharacterized protein LOC121419597 [Lytechinus variegatus]
MFTGRHHAFEVSIQTDSIPIIGEDFTLVCSFTPETIYKHLVWKKGENIQVASHSCWRSLYYCPVNSIPFPLKFSLKTDNSSGNLTIRNLNEDDISDYRCSLSSGEISGSAIKQVKPLTPDPPNRILITAGRKTLYCFNNVSVTAGKQHNITCESMWSRPPAILKWRIPECVPAVVQDQSDVIHGNFYISRKTVTITPSKDNDGKILSCTASHPELEKELNCSMDLKVQVWPMNMLLFTTGGNQSQLTDIYVQEDSPTSITCKAIGSFPAVDLPVSFPYGSDIIPITNSSKNSSLFDEKLFDTDTTIKIYPKKTDHGKYIRCYAFMDSEVVGLESAKLMVYGLQSIKCLYFSITSEA